MLPSEWALVLVLALALPRALVLGLVSERALVSELAWELALASALAEGSGLVSELDSAPRLPQHPTAQRSTHRYRNPDPCHPYPLTYSWN